MQAAALLCIYLQAFPLIFLRVVCYSITHTSVQCRRAHQAVQLVTERRTVFCSFFTYIFFNSSYVNMYGRNIEALPADGRTYYALP